MLLIDFGNSAVKGQWWCKGELQFSFSCQLGDHWQTRLKAILAGIDASRCYYACVANPELEVQLLSCLNELEQLNIPVRLTAQANADGVQSGYAEPEKLGIDRWLALIGATTIVHNGAPVDKLIIDAGSAITVDLLTSDGKHLGGAILPGFNTTIERFKQIMSKADFNHPDIQNIDEPGCSTEACIQINCESETASNLRVDNLIDKWLARLSPDAILIVAGGDAVQIRSHGSHLRHEIPDLVFRGMIKHLENQQ